jgi:hypothetical protein
MEKKEIGNYVQYGCTALIILTFCVLLFLVMNKAIPKENEQTVNLMLGALGTMVGTVFSFWWGSSAGSVRNAERLHEVLNTTIPTGGAITQTTETVTKKEADKP